MKKQTLLASVLVLCGAGIAHADHNSKWGEGTALDPRGIHDARIDSLDADKGTAFKGAGLTGPMDLTTSFARQGRPDTIEVSSAGRSSDTGSGGSSDHGGGNGGGGNGGGNGGGGNGGGGNGGGGNGGGGNGR